MKRKKKRERSKWLRICVGVSCARARCWTWHDNLLGAPSYIQLELQSSLYEIKSPQYSHRVNEMRRTTNGEARKTVGNFFIKKRRAPAAKWQHLFGSSWRKKWIYLLIHNTSTRGALALSLASALLLLCIFVLSLFRDSIGAILMFGDLLTFLVTEWEREKGKIQATTPASHRE